MSDEERAEFNRQLVDAMPKVKAFAHKLTRNAADAEDLLQDALERGMRAATSFTLGTSMSGWLCFIARNQFYSNKRRSWRQQPLPDNADEWMIPVDASAHHRVELQDALEALSYLDKLHREVILAGAEGLSIEEMAAEFGTSEGTIKSRIHRGRAALDLFFAASKG